MDNFLSVAEISDKLKIPVNTVRDWLRRGVLKGIRLGRHWRIKESDLENFIKEQEENKNNEQQTI